MEVIAHQTVRINPPVRFLASLVEGLQKQFPILVILKDPTPPVAAIHDMVNRPGVLNAQLSSHGL
jgi:hypothetical protein